MWQSGDNAALSSGSICPAWPAYELWSPVDEIHKLYWHEQKQKKALKTLKIFVFVPKQGHLHCRRVWKRTWFDSWARLHPSQCYINHMCISLFICRWGRANRIIPNTVSHIADSCKNRRVVLIKCMKTLLVSPQSAAGAVISKSNKRSRGFLHPPIWEQISSKSAPIIKRLQGRRGPPQWTGPTAEAHSLLWELVMKERFASAVSSLFLYIHESVNEAETWCICCDTIWLNLDLGVGSGGLVSSEGHKSEPWPSGSNSSLIVYIIQHF